MKKSVIVVLLIAVILSLQAQENKPFLDNVYLGTQFTGSFTTSEITNFGYQNLYSIRVALDKDIELPFGSLYVMGCYDNVSNDGGSSFTFIKWHAQITKKLSFSIGQMPKALPYFMRPGPVSGAAHFENKALIAMPGSGLGTSLNYRMNERGDEFFLGVYQNENYNGELNFGAKISTTNGWSFKVAGLYNLLERYDTVPTTNLPFAGALQISHKFGNFTIFGTQDGTGNRVYSSYLEIHLNNGLNPNIGYIHRENKLDVPNEGDYLEFAINKTLGHKLKFIHPDLNLMVSAGYIHLPERSFNITLQLSIE